MNQSSMCGWWITRSPLLLHLLIAHTITFFPLAVLSLCISSHKQSFCGSFVWRLYFLTVIISLPFHMLTVKPPYTVLPKQYIKFDKMHLCALKNAHTQALWHKEWQHFYQQPLVELNLQLAFWQALSVEEVTACECASVLGMCAFRSNMCLCLRLEMEGSH